MSNPENPEVKRMPFLSASRRRLARNVAFNWSGMISEAAIGIITVPLLIHRLGDVVYGLWILIGALAGYFQFLDLGLRGSIGRYIAFYEARGDEDALGRTLSTACAVLCGAGLVAFLGGLGLVVGFPHIIEVPSEMLAPVRLAWFIVAINLAIYFVSRAFDAVLWGFQRFDLLNLIDVPTALARLGLTFAFVQGEYGLVSLAWITLSTTAVSGLLKAALAFRLSSSLRLRISLIDRSHARELLGFGFWQFVAGAARLTLRTVIPVVIAVTLGVGMVVPFSIAQRLVEVARGFLMAATGVLSPLATALHAQENSQRQRQMFIEATRYCCCLSLFFVASMLLLGRETIELWVGADYASTFRYLAILAVGSVLPMAFLVSNSVLIGMGKVRIMAAISVADTTVAIAAAFLLGRAGDLTTICLALAISATVFQGVIRPLVVCHAMDLRPRTVIGAALLPAIGSILMPAMLLWLALQYRDPQSWMWLMIYSVTFGLLTIGSVGLGLLGLRATKRRGWAFHR